jgi:hypothetical protein
MTSQEITDQLQGIASVGDSATSSEELGDTWSSVGVGIEAVEPVLRFMEEHPNIDFGMPGPLVHFVERFYGSGYQEKLLESLVRKPTPMTIWMLNRVINGTREPEIRRQLIASMERTRTNPLADREAIQWANRFLERLSRG